MKIMVVGVCDIAHSTNAFMANALKDLGHTVVCYNYRTRLKTYYGNQGKLEEDFIITVKAIKDNGGLDLIIFCKTDTLPVSAMQIATSMVKTFYWFMDPITTANIMLADLRASSCTAASATCMEVVNFFKEKGQPNSYKINEGADLELFTPKRMKKAHDVLFVGSPTPERYQSINYLMSNGITVKVFGDGWHGNFGANHPIYNASLVSEIYQARVVLNVSRTDSYSDRVTLSMAAGAFVITSDVNEIHTDFLVGRHLETFSNDQDLYEKISYFLKNEDERERIAEHGCALVHDRYGWETVCQNILGKVNNNELF